MSLGPLPHYLATCWRPVDQTVGWQPVEILNEIELSCATGSASAFVQPDSQHDSHWRSQRHTFSTDC
jgi:hypothetical protein